MPTPGENLALPPPVLPKEVNSLPQGEDWIYEFLWSGERVRAVRDERGVQLFSRDGRKLANRFPRVAAAVAKMSTDPAVIDGEILMLDGYSEEAVKFLSRVSDDISQAQVALVAYDLLQHRRRDLRETPLLGRRFLLASIVQGTPIILSPLINRSPEAALAEAAQLGLAGIVAKRAGSSYRPNALTTAWVKVTLGSQVPAGGRSRSGGSRTPWPPTVESHGGALAST